MDKTTKIIQDITILKLIHLELEENNSDNEWDLCDGHKEQLEEITGLEQHDWDENNLAHFIDGMQRTLQLLITK